MPVLAQLLVSDAVYVDAGNGEYPTGRVDASELGDMLRDRLADNISYLTSGKEDP